MQSTVYSNLHPVFMGNIVKIGFILYIVLQIELQTNPILHFGGIMSNIAYVRVSSADQNEARQTEALKVYDIQKWFRLLP